MYVQQVYAVNLIISTTVFGSWMNDVQFSGRQFLLSATFTRTFRRRPNFRSSVVTINFGYAKLSHYYYIYIQTSTYSCMWTLDNMWWCCFTPHNILPLCQQGINTSGISNSSFDSKFVGKLRNIYANDGCLVTIQHNVGKASGLFQSSC